MFLKPTSTNFWGKDDKFENIFVRQNLAIFTNGIKLAMIEQFRVCCIFGKLLPSLLASYVLLFLFYSLK